MTTLNTLRPRSTQSTCLMCLLIYRQSTQGICTWSCERCLPSCIWICALQECSARRTENMETGEIRSVSLVIKYDTKSRVIVAKINAKQHKCDFVPSSKYQIDIFYYLKKFYRLNNSFKKNLVFITMVHSCFSVYHIVPTWNTLDTKDERQCFDF